MTIIYEKEEYEHNQSDYLSPEKTPMVSGRKKGDGGRGRAAWDEHFICVIFRYFILTLTCSLGYLK